MPTHKKYYVRTLAAALLVALCGLGFWQWSNHDDYMVRRALGADICGDRACEADRYQFTAEYAHDSSVHAWVAIALIPAAALAALAGGVDFIIISRR